MSNPYEDALCSPKKEKQARIKRQKEFLRDGNCKFCGSISSITKDHILPKSRGGKNHIDNFQPLCSYCNSQKGNKTDLELKVIFADIKEKGIWYDWEKKYAQWLVWLESVCKERNHNSPLL